MSCRSEAPPWIFFLPLTHSLTVLTLGITFFLSTFLKVESLCLLKTLMYLHNIEHSILPATYRSRTWPKKQSYSPNLLSFFQSRSRPPLTKYLGLKITFLSYFKLIRFNAIFSLCSLHTVRLSSSDPIYIVTNYTNGSLLGKTVS